MKRTFFLENERYIERLCFFHGHKAHSDPLLSNGLGIAANRCNSDRVMDWPMFTEYHEADRATS
jgi:hypothetical protein